MERVGRETKRRVPGGRHGAVLLLAVLLCGLLITSFTHSWIGDLPYHTHLFLGLQHSHTHNHVHPGDALAQAGLALTMVAPLPPQAVSTEQRVISLTSNDDGQLGLSTYTGAGLLSSLLLLLLAAAGRPVARREFLLLVGVILDSPVPPPR